MFERTVQPVLDVKDKPKPAQWAFLSLQHLFAMFGSTVLVPFLTGLPISAALLQELEHCYTYSLLKLKYQHIWALVLLSSHQSLQD